MEGKLLIGPKRCNRLFNPVFGQVLAWQAKEFAFVQQDVRGIYILAEGENRILPSEERRQKMERVVLSDHLILIPSNT